MKCKRLSAWFLSLVMMFSLLPVSAAAVKWYDKHSVTVKYEFKDDSSKSKPDYVIKTIASHVGAITPYRVEEPGYNHSAKVTSGNAECSIDAGFLHVKHVDADSVITVTYTPKGNVITIDQYYNNGTILAKWGTNIKVNGLDIVENNKLEKGAIIDNTELTDATEKYRFLTVGGKTYDFSYARQIPYPGASSSIKLTDVWYERDTGEWYYAHFNNTKVLLGNKSGVNFCYNVQHTEASAHHQFDQFVETVAPTCTEKGYTVYKCAYCTETEKCDYTGPLGHQWGDWVHVDGTEKEKSQHQQVCKRCSEKGITEKCEFKSESIGTETEYTCTKCGSKYTESVPKTTPVYVYFKTVHSKDGNVRVNDGDGVTYNNNTGNNNTGEKWATLGKLVTATNVATASAEELGNEVIAGTGFTRHDSNSRLDLSLIKSWGAPHKENGAADYVEFGTEAWHLDGKVNVYKLSYDANRPDGVTASVTVPDSAYYLPNWNAPVSKVVPTLQGYVFGGWYTEKACEHKVEKTVTVSEDTVLYAKWKPITADLIDDDITITHGVNGAPADGDDSTAHIVKKNAKISYQATLDMQSLKFGANPEHADDVSFIQAMIGTGPLWEFMEGKNITTFAGSKVNLYVKFSDKLVNPATLDGITLKSGWFKLDQNNNNKPTYNSSTGYWTIPCVIKNAEDAPDTSKSIITLSGVSLSLTDTAQDELSRDTPMTITSEGYIDGMIMISGRALKLESKTAKNTAKLKLAVPTYTVTYDANGGSGTMTDKKSPYADGAVATVLTNGFTRSRYTFTGWNTEPDGSGKSYAEGVSIKMLGNVVLYAQWSKNSSHDDDDDKYFFAIQKVDAQDGHALNDAKFELYQRDSRDNKLPASRKTTAHWGTESGIALFSVSATKTSDGGSTWYYREITAPEGYVLDTKEYEISAGDFYHDDQSKAVAKAKTVRNYRGTTPDLLNDSDHFAYVIGYMDGNVRPYGLISRAETTTIFFRLLKDSVRDGNLLTSNTYTDVADDYWANTAISTMTGLGIVQGRSTTTFDPKAPITRAQFAAICARFDTGKSSGEQTFSDIQGHWAEKYIQRAAELGWIKGFEDGTFRPDTYITRAQAMTMINRVLNRIPEDESDLLPGMNVWPDCNPGDWFYLAVQEATNSHDFEDKAGNYETWTKLMKNPDWTRYEN